jgi:hypothetical protein
MKSYLSALAFFFIFSSQSTMANEFYSLQDSTLKKSTSTASIQDSTKKKKATAKPFPKSKLGVDIMVLMTGEEKEVEIRKFSTKYIYYSSPRESSMKQVDRRLVNIIYYRSGRKEIITPKAVDIPKNSDWEKIKITEDPKEVSPLMVEIDVIEVVVEASGREQYYKPQTLENSAYIVLKKKAALLNAELVLIKKKSHSRPYGEAPSLTVEAIAYRKI